MTSSLGTSASSSAEPKAGASSRDRRDRVHADRRTFAGHPDSAVDRRDLRQGRGRKRGDTARSGRSLTDGLTRSTRTYPQVTADRTRGNTRRIAVSLACKQGVGGSSPLAGSSSCRRIWALTCTNTVRRLTLDRCSPCRIVRLVSPSSLPHSLPHTNRCARCASPPCSVAGMRLRRRPYGS